VDDASSRARESREKADSDAMARVQDAEQATERMLERTGGVESEIDRLLGEMRSAAGALVENLRGSAAGLTEELTQIRSEFAGVREARLETGGGGVAAVPDPEPELVTEADEPSVVDDEPGPVDADEDVVAEVQETAVTDVPADEDLEDSPVAEAEADLGTEDDDEPVAAEEAPTEPRGGGRSIRGAEGARLIALNMALNGTPREETARYLSQNFDLDDQDSLLDEVYARVGG
jgi:hypothetical protein